MRIGGTDYPQNQLGTSSSSSTPTWEAPSARAEFGEVESTKSTSDLIAPVSGEVISVNADLGDRPELVTSQRDDNADLLDASGYEATIA